MNRENEKAMFAGKKVTGIMSIAKLTELKRKQDEKLHKSGTMAIIKIEQQIDQLKLKKMDLENSKSRNELNAKHYWIPNEKIGLYPNTVQNALQDITDVGTLNNQERPEKVVKWRGDWYHLQIMSPDGNRETMRAEFTSINTNNKFRVD
tara:strand:+ start:448 stop:894 length:447 start_codon:yes stop_codon:yes gene_type:complete